MPQCPWVLLEHRWEESFLPGELGNASQRWCLTYVRRDEQVSTRWASGGNEAGPWSLTSQRWERVSDTGSKSILESPQGKDIPSLSKSLACVWGACVIWASWISTVITLSQEDATSTGGSEDGWQQTPASPSLPGSTSAWSIQADYSHYLLLSLSTSSLSLPPSLFWVKLISYKFTVWLWCHFPAKYI